MNAHTSAMPDRLGTNADHDARYLRRLGGMIVSPLAFVDGTAAAPILVFMQNAGDDWDTGMYSDAANVIGFSCGGTMWGRLDGPLNNVFWGNLAGAGATTGTRNVAIGDQALEANQTGSNNVAIGYRAGEYWNANVDGSNVFIGNLAGRNRTGLACIKNIMIGQYAGGGSAAACSGSFFALRYSGYNATTCTDAIAIGLQSAYTYSGDRAIYIGYNSGYVSGANDDTVAIGSYSLYRGSGNYTIAIGYYSGGGGLVGVTATVDSVFIGRQAGYDSKSSDGCVCVGTSAGSENRTGDYNTYVGYESGLGVDSNSNSQNSGYGYGTLHGITTGSYNTALGDLSGYNLSTADQCVFIGHESGYYESGSSKLFIDNIRRGSEADGRIKALVYGVFDALTANQYLYVNGQLMVRRETTDPLFVINYNAADNAGDPQTVYQENSVGVWSHGVDTANSNRFVLASNATVGGQTDFVFQYISATYNHGIGINKAPAVNFDMEAPRCAYDMKATSNAQFAQFRALNDQGVNAYFAFLLYGSAYAGSTYGLTRANRVFVTAGGASVAGMALGTQSNTPLSIITNSTNQWEFEGGGDLVAQDDNLATIWGASGDCSTTFNATDMITDFDLLNAGTTDYRVQQNGNDRLAVLANNVVQSYGGRIHNTTRVAASPYNVLVADEVIFVDTDGGAITVNLPAGAEGAHYKIINCGTSGNNVTVDGNGAETVYGLATQTLNDGDVLDIHYNATEGWW